MMLKFRKWIAEAIFAIAVFVMPRGHVEAPVVQSERFTRGGDQKDTWIAEDPTDYSYRDL